MLGLKVEPELWSRPERTGEQPRGLWCDATLAPNEFVDPLDRNIEVFCQRDLSDAERLDEFLKEDLARMGRYSILRQHLYSLVIVDNLDFMGVAVVPPKNDPPLVVDTDTVLATKLSL